MSDHSGQPQFTSCEKRYKSYPLVDVGPEERQKSINRALRRFLFNVPTSQLQYASWHFQRSPDTKECGNLRPLSQLVDGTVKDEELRDNKIHIHFELPEEDEEGDEEEDEEEDEGNGDGKPVEEEKENEGLQSQSNEDSKEKGGVNETSTERQGDEANDGDNDADEDDPCPFNDPDNETEAIPPNPAASDVYIRLVYDWSGDTKTNPERWQPHVLRFTEDTPFHQVTKSIRAYVSKRLRIKEPRYCKHLKDKNTYAVLAPFLETDDTVGQYAFKLDASGLERLLNLRDLCPNSHGSNTAELILHLKQIDELKRTGLDVNSRVAIRPSSAPYYDFFQCGSLPRKQAARSLTAEEKKLPKEFLTIPCSNTYFWSCGQATPEKKALLLSVPSRTLRNTLYCDFESAVKVSPNNKIPDDLIVSPQYLDGDGKRSAEYFSDLLDVFKKGLSAGTEQPYKGSRPSYCFTPFVPGSDGLGVSNFPKPIITFAVRFVNHVNDLGAQTIEFSHDEELMVDEYDTLHTIRESIFSLLEGANEGDGKRLLKKPFQQGHNWEMDLWVAPQDHNRTYRFDPQHSAQNFVLQKLVDKKDMRVLMEVHIVEVPKPKPASSVSQRGRERPKIEEYGK